MEEVARVSSESLTGSGFEDPESKMISPNRGLNAVLSSLLSLDEEGA
jgi:hypothetical protein